MLNLTCYVGRLRSDIDLPFPLTLMGRTIHDYYSLGSQDNNGNPEINLVVDEVSRFNASQIPYDRPTSPIYLQWALGRLTQNPLNTNGVNKIGLVIADSFAPKRSLLGLMFDYGFNPGGLEPVSSMYTSVPREGCAIFLNAIRSIRGTMDEYRREVVFTAIHELGHVFNLWHLNNPINFMSTSNPEATYPPSTYYFHRSQSSFLNRASIDENVWPGGSIYEHRGAYGPAANDPFANIHSTTDLRLTINIEQKEFWFFEPIELDIKIKSRKGEYDLPDKIDPGYEDFIIHISKPDGTIMKYRSPRVYCQNPGRITIKPNQPFQRDVSIFGQSGGYTFTQPGIYKIRCGFKVSEKKYIISNTIEVHLKEPLVSNKKFNDIKTFLTKKNAAQFLYHRSGNYNKAILSALHNVARKNSKIELGNNILYALLKYRTHKLKKSTSKDTLEILNTLKRILDSGKLSKNRIKNLCDIQMNLEVK